MLTITDTAGTSGSVTVESHDVADAIRPWYPEATDEVYQAIEELQAALNRNEDTGGMCEYLSITIERA